MTSSEEKGLAALAHVLGLFTGFLGPLILYLVKTQEGLARDQAREALNFQITVLIAAAVSGLLMVILIGIPLMFAVAIGNLVLCIIAAVKASEGNMYRYPVAIRFVAGPRAGAQA